MQQRLILLLLSTGLIGLLYACHSSLFTLENNSNTPTNHFIIIKLGETKTINTTPNNAFIIELVTDKTSSHSEKSPFNFSASTSGIAWTTDNPDCANIENISNDNNSVTVKTFNEHISDRCTANVQARSQGEVATVRFDVSYKGGSTAAKSLFGVDYAWLGVDRCRIDNTNGEPKANSGCNINAANENNSYNTCSTTNPCPYAGGGTIYPQKNGLASLNKCIQCYETDMNQMANVVKLKQFRIYSPNYSVLAAAKNYNLKVMLGTDNETVNALAQNKQQTNGLSFVQNFVEGGDKEGLLPNGKPYFFATPLRESIDNGTIISIILGNELNSAGITPDTVARAASNLRKYLTSPGAGGTIQNTGTLSIETTMASIMNTAGYCQKSELNKIGFDFYCNGNDDSPPTASPPASCAQQEIIPQYRKIPPECNGKSYIAEVGYTTGALNATPGSNRPDTYSAQLGVLQAMYNFGCTNQVETNYFEWFDDYKAEKNNTVTKFYGIYLFQRDANAGKYTTKATYDPQILFQSCTIP